MEQNQPRNLKEALDAAAQEIAVATTPLEGARTLSTSQVSDVEKLLAAAERMLIQQRQKRVEAESTHLAKRQEIVNQYRSRILKLEHAAHDELRALDMNYGKFTADLELVLAKLEALRGA